MHWGRYLHPFCHPSQRSMDLWFPCAISCSSTCSLRWSCFYLVCLGCDFTSCQRLLHKSKHYFSMTFLSCSKCWQRTIHRKTCYSMRIVRFESIVFILQIVYYRNIFGRHLWRFIVVLMGITRDVCMCIADNIVSTDWFSFSQEGNFLLHACFILWLF